MEGDFYYYPHLQCIWMWHMYPSLYVAQCVDKSGYAYTLHLHSGFCKVSAVVLK